MIVNIRGTSGSGKTHLVRKLMSEYGQIHKIQREGRKQPIAYVCCDPDKKAKVAVIGHYETVCGGCDTINKVEDTFNLVVKYTGLGYNVIFEGLLISADVNRVALLTKHSTVVVIALDVPVQECLDSVNARRRAKKPDAADVNPKNTMSKHRGVTNSIKRLEDMGVSCHLKNRDEAIKLARELLETH